MEQVDWDHYLNFCSPHQPHPKEGVCCDLLMEVDEDDTSYYCSKCGTVEPYLVVASEWQEDIRTHNLYLRSNYFTKLLYKFGLIRYREPLLFLFNQLCSLYNQVRGSRKNFISYSFVIQQLCLMIGVEPPPMKMPSKKILKRVQKIWSQMVPKISLHYRDES